MNERERHLSTDVWERLACDELSSIEEKAAREHIAACGDCQATWAAVADLRAAAETFDPGLRKPLPEPLLGRFGTSAQWAPFAMAAVLTAVVGVGL